MQHILRSNTSRHLVTISPNDGDCQSQESNLISNKGHDLGEPDLPVSSTPLPVRKY
jgi:hypothetical protein